MSVRVPEALTPLLSISFDLFSESQANFFGKQIFFPNSVSWMGGLETDSDIIHGTALTDSDRRNLTGFSGFFIGHF